MFTNIRTSKDNKEVVSKLTRKLNLGAENVIARIALAYSLKSNNKLDIKNLQDSGGKEYSRKVLFGDYDKYYLALVAQHYQLHISNQDIGKYVKLHLDDGIQLLNEEINERSNIDGFDFLVEKIETGLIEI
jgi:DNA sulfur modification protein DndE